MHSPDWVYDERRPVRGCKVHVAVRSISGVWPDLDMTCDLQIKWLLISYFKVFIYLFIYFLTYLTSRGFSAVYAVAIPCLESIVLKNGRNECPQTYSHTKNTESSLHNDTRDASWRAIVGGNSLNLRFNSGWLKHRLRSTHYFSLLITYSFKVLIRSVWSRSFVCRLAGFAVSIDSRVIAGAFYDAPRQVVCGGMPQQLSG